MSKGNGNGNGNGKEKKTSSPKGKVYEIKAGVLKAKGLTSAMPELSFCFPTDMIKVVIPVRKPPVLEPRPKAPTV